jgi:AcrR family transcriptional regulator
MRSADQLPAFEDLTARARIRDAALRQFAERGMDGATIRGIAADAGVSLGLVQHHYGSKQGLRAACDAYVLETIRGYAREVVDERRAGDPAFVEATYAGGPLLTRYLVRALLDDSPASAALFDEIVGLTEAYLTGLSVSTASRDGTAGADDPADVRARAAVLTAMKLGVGVFQDQLARVLGERDLVRDAYPRIARATLDLLSPRAVDPQLAAAARAGLDRYRQAAPKRRPRTRARAGR